MQRRAVDWRTGSLEHQYRRPGAADHQRSECRAQPEFRQHTNRRATVPFDINDPTTFHSSTAVSVYDSLGNDQTLQMFYVKRPTGDWDVYAANDGTQIGAGAIATLNFGTDGLLTTAMPLAPINVPATATGA